MRKVGLIVHDSVTYKVDDEDWELFVIHGLEIWLKREQLAAWIVLRASV
jgi:hypothetical protein